MFGDHKIQKTLQEFAHPYEPEIQAFTEEIVNSIDVS